MESLVADLVSGATDELQRVLDMGGAVSAVESGYMKSELVRSHTRRRARMESGEDIVVGRQTPSPRRSRTRSSRTSRRLSSRSTSGVEAAAIADVTAWRAARDTAEAGAALDELRAQAAGSGNLMEVSLRCARAGVTTGEWAAALREVFGEYRAPTGVSAAIGVEGAGPGLASAREAVRLTVSELGAPLRFLVGKPGLDGHSNGAEQIAVRARDAGFEVVYQGIRLTPGEIVTAAVAEDVDVVGISILSGSHRELVPEIIEGLRAQGLDAVSRGRRRESSRTRTPSGWGHRVSLRSSPRRTTTPTRS